MDHAFWIDRWQKADTGFHRANPHRLLTTYWPQMALAPASGVFVPLCGKSSDMTWLAAQGHKVIGSELSPIAVDAFFKDQGLTPQVEPHGALVHKSADAYHLWQGDILQLTPAHVGTIAAVYDRAALVALPTEMQWRYTALLATLMPAGGKLFLISLSYDQGEMDGPPFSMPAETIRSLFADKFDIDHVNTNPEALEESGNLKKRGLSKLTETLQILTRRST